MDQKNQPSEARAPHASAEERSPVIQARFQKAKDLADTGVPLYPNAFRPADKAGDVRSELEEASAEDLEAEPRIKKLAGRLMARRDYG